ncbi:unnamed protein product, partial [Ixodes hexagonus]
SESGSIACLTFALPAAVAGRLGSARTQRQVEVAATHRRSRGARPRRRSAPRTGVGAVARGVALDGSGRDEHPGRMLESPGRKQGARAAAAAAEHAHTRAAAPHPRGLAERRAA